MSGVPKLEGPGSPVPALRLCMGAKVGGAGFPGPCPTASGNVGGLRPALPLSETIGLSRVPHHSPSVCFPLVWWPAGVSWGFGVHVTLLPKFADTRRSNQLLNKVIQLPTGRRDVATAWNQKWQRRLIVATLDDSTTGAALLRRGPATAPGMANVGSGAMGHPKSQLATPGEPQAIREH